MIAAFQEIGDGGAESAQSGAEERGLCWFADNDAGPGGQAEHGEYAQQNEMR